MLYVRNIPITVPPVDIINRLRDDLLKLGINRFSRIRVSADNIQVTCPIHKDGQERTPSCGIRITDVESTKAGTVHCFTCGYVASFEEMISTCFGYDDRGIFGERWLIQNFVIPYGADIDLDLLVDKSKQEGNKNIITPIENLNLYNKKHPYMYQRKLNDAVIDAFNVGFDANFELSNGEKSITIPCITFPVRDKKGNVLFVARRAVDRKFFHYPSNVDKPVYGLYELSDDATEVIVCESIINALTCYVYGKSAVALLGLGTKKQYEQLAELKCRKLILGFDGDIAGERAIKKLYKELKNKKLITRLDIPKGKDINDLSEKEFNELNEYFV